MHLPSGVGRWSRPAHRSSGAAGVHAGTPRSCEVPSTDPAAPPFRARVKPHADLFTYSRNFGFLNTRSLPGKTKSRHCHRGQRPGGFHPPASLAPWLPWFQHLRSLLPRQDLLSWLSPQPRGSPSPAFSPLSSALEQPSPATLPFGSRLFPGCHSSGNPPGARTRDRRAAPGGAGHLPSLSPGTLRRPRSPSCPSGPSRTRYQRGARKRPGAAYREGCWVRGPLTESTPSASRRRGLSAPP